MSVPLLATWPAMEEREKEIFCGGDILKRYFGGGDILVEENGRMEKVGKFGGKKRKERKRKKEKKMKREDILLEEK